MTEYRHIIQPSISYLEQCGRLLLDSRSMAEAIGVPRPVLQQLVYCDRIPLPVRLGLGKTMRWNVMEVLEWIHAGCPRRTEWIRIHGKSGWYRQ